MTPARLMAAISIYAVLALAALFTLDGKIRLATLVVLAGLAAKTWIAYLREGYR